MTRTARRIDHDGDRVEFSDGPGGICVAVVTEPSGAASRRDELCAGPFSIGELRSALDEVAPLDETRPEVIQHEITITGRMDPDDVARAIQRQMDKGSALSPAPTQTTYEYPRDRPVLDPSPPYELKPLAPTSDEDEVTAEVRKIAAPAINHTMMVHYRERALEAEAFAAGWKETARRAVRQATEARQYQKMTQANFDYMARQRDEARATAGELRAEQGAAERERDAVADGLAVWESLTARELLEKAWEAAHVPTDGTIPAGAGFMVRRNGGEVSVRPDGSRLPLPNHWEGIERRLIDPPTPTRPDGAEEWDEELGEMPAASDLTPEQRTRLADALAERDHAIGVRAPEGGEER